MCQQCVELTAELERLKLKLFWKENNVSELKAAMAHANQNNGINCTCLACAVSGRKDEDDGVAAKGFDCAFKLYFERVLAQCGLVVSHFDFNAIVETHTWVSDGNSLCDVDAHLLYVGRDDWNMFSYGTKLWSAKSASDPELAKLTHLFALLGEEDNEDDDNAALKAAAS
jgi:hypothetical protein